LLVDVIKGMTVCWQKVVMRLLPAFFDRSGTSKRSDAYFETEALNFGKGVALFDCIN
jgi:hypothetical protein